MPVRLSTWMCVAMTALWVGCGNDSGGGTLETSSASASDSGTGEDSASDSAHEDIVDTQTLGGSSDSISEDSETHEDTDSGSDPLVFPDDPGQTGPCTFKTESVKVPSSEGDYKISATIYVPNVHDGSAEVVVVNHGNQISGNMYTNVAEHLASWCYAAVINDYVSTLVPATPPERTVRDTVDVLRYAQSASAPSLDGVVKPDGGAIVGHSKGGSMGLWAAAENKGAVAAFVGLDPVWGHSAIENPEVYGTVEVPSLIIGELWSATHAIGGQACAPLESNFQKFYSLLPEGLPALEITFAQAMHMSWLDAPKGCGLACAACPDNPNADHEQVRAMSRRFTVAWLERYLRGRVEMETYLFGDEMAQDVASGAVTTRSK